MRSGFNIFIILTMIFLLSCTMMLLACSQETSNANIQGKRSEASLFTIVKLQGDMLEQENGDTDNTSKDIRPETISGTPDIYTSLQQGEYGESLMRIAD
ncbi:MAG: hypothetical protein WEB89_02765 [Balneolales bacterium]